MLNIKLNKEIYELPLGDSYRDKLNVFSDNISIDGLSDYKAYKLLNKVYLCVSEALVSLEQNNCPLELEAERNEIFRNILPIFENQKQSAQQGFYSESNKLLKEFLLLMLNHYEKFKQLQRVSTSNITR